MSKSSRKRARRARLNANKSRLANGSPSLPSSPSDWSRLAVSPNLPRDGFVQMGYASARPNSDTWRSVVKARPETTLQAQNSDDRAALRSQARFEFMNNPRAAGIARLFSLYVVGVGPRLKFKGFRKYLNVEVDRALVDYVNYRWETFADRARFAPVLRQAMQSFVVDGEAFLVLAPSCDRRLPFSIQLLDAQRVGNPNGERSTSVKQDGVYLNADGSPAFYCVYDVPEYESSYYDRSKYRVYSSEQVFHLFREDLPGQTRGISWFAPVLNLMQQLREYTEATVEAAKASAKVFATVETQSGYALDCVDEHFLAPEQDYPYSAYQTFDTPNGQMIHLPVGTTMKSFAPAQPTTTADAFASSLMAQIGYSMGLPRNKATGSSHEYNFASGRLDNQPFEMTIETLQRDIFERGFCDKLFLRFYEQILGDALGRFANVPTVDECEWEWVWAKPPLVDAEATARTNAIRVQSNQATLSEVWNETHAYSEFDDVREEFKKDMAEFPAVFGAAPENDGGFEPEETNPNVNTRIDEPKTSANV